MPNISIMDERVQNLFRCAEKVGLPVTTDGSDRPERDFGLYDLPGLPGLEHTLQRFPNLKFIAHGPMFWAEYTTCRRPARHKAIFGPDGLQHGSPAISGKIQSEGIVQELLREFPNLYGELSDAFGQLSRDEDYAVQFLTEFQDRLFFGTDCCNSETEANFYAKMWFDKMHDSGKLPDDVWKKICRNNAIRFFGLDFPEA